MSSSTSGFVELGDLAPVRRDRVTQSVLSIAKKIARQRHPEVPTFSAFPDDPEDELERRRAKPLPVVSPAPSDTRSASYTQALSTLDKLKQTKRTTEQSTATGAAQATAANLPIIVDFLSETKQLQHIGQIYASFDDSVHSICKFAKDLALRFIREDGEPLETTFRPLYQARLYGIHEDIGIDAFRTMNIQQGPLQQGYTQLHGTDSISLREFLDKKVSDSTEHLSKLHLVVWTDAIDTSSTALHPYFAAQKSQAGTTVELATLKKTETPIMARSLLSESSVQAVARAIYSLSLSIRLPTNSAGHMFREKLELISPIRRALESLLLYPAEFPLALKALETLGMTNYFRLLVIACFVPNEPWEWQSVGKWLLPSTSSQLVRATASLRLYYECARNESDPVSDSKLAQLFSQLTDVVRIHARDSLPAIRTCFDSCRTPLPWGLLMNILWTLALLTTQHSAQDSWVVGPEIGLHPWGVLRHTLFTRDCRLHQQAYNVWLHAVFEAGLLVMTPNEPISLELLDLIFLLQWLASADISPHLGYFLVLCGVHSMKDLLKAHMNGWLACYVYVGPNKETLTQHVDRDDTSFAPSSEVQIWVPTDAGTDHTGPTRYVRSIGYLVLDREARTKLATETRSVSTAVSTKRRSDFSNIFQAALEGPVDDWEDGPAAEMWASAEASDARASAYNEDKMPGGLSDAPLGDDQANDTGQSDALLLVRVDDVLKRGRYRARLGASATSLAPRLGPFLQAAIRILSSQSPSEESAKAIPTDLSWTRTEALVLEALISEVCGDSDRSTPTTSSLSSPSMPDQLGKEIEASSKAPSLVAMTRNLQVNETERVQEVKTVSERRSRISPVKSGTVPTEVEMYAHPIGSSSSEAVVEEKQSLEMSETSVCISWQAARRWQELLLRPLLLGHPIDLARLREAISPKLQVEHIRSASCICVDADAKNKTFLCLDVWINRIFPLLQCYQLFVQDHLDCKVLANHEGRRTALKTSKVYRIHELLISFVVKAYREAYQNLSKMLNEVIDDETLNVGYVELVSECSEDSLLSEITWRECLLDCLNAPIISGPAYSGNSILTLEQDQVLAAMYHSDAKIASQKRSFIERLAEHHLNALATYCAASSQLAVVTPVSGHFAALGETLQQSLRTAGKLDLDTLDIQESDKLLAFMPFERPAIDEPEFQEFIHLTLTWERIHEQTVQTETLDSPHDEYSSLDAVPESQQTEPSCEISHLASTSISVSADISAVTVDTSAAAVDTLRHSRPRLPESARLQALFHLLKRMERSEEGLSDSTITEAMQCLESARSNQDYLTEQFLASDVISVLQCERLLTSRHTAPVLVKFILSLAAATRVPMNNVIQVAKPFEVALTRLCIGALVSDKATETHSLAVAVIGSINECLRDLTNGAKSAKPILKICLRRSEASSSSDSDADEDEERDTSYRCPISKTDTSVTSHLRSSAPTQAGGASSRTGLRPSQSPSPLLCPLDLSRLVQNSLAQMLASLEGLDVLIAVDRLCQGAETTKQLRQISWRPLVPIIAERIQHAMEHVNKENLEEQLIQLPNMIRCLVATSTRLAVFATPFSTSDTAQLLALSCALLCESLRLLELHSSVSRIPKASYPRPLWDNSGILRSQSIYSDQELDLVSDKLHWTILHSGGILDAAAQVLASLPTQSLRTYLIAEHDNHITSSPWSRSFAAAKQALRGGTAVLLPTTAQAATYPCARSGFSIPELLRDVANNLVMLVMEPVKHSSPALADLSRSPQSAITDAGFWPSLSARQCLLARLPISLVCYLYEGAFSKKWVSYITLFTDEPRLSLTPNVVPALEAWGTFYRCYIVALREPAQILRRSYTAAGFPNADRFDEEFCDISRLCETLAETELLFTNTMGRLSEVVTSQHSAQPLLPDHRLSASSSEDRSPLNHLRRIVNCNTHVFTALHFASRSIYVWDGLVKAVVEDYLSAHSSNHDIETQTLTEHETKALKDLGTCDELEFNLDDASSVDSPAVTSQVLSSPIYTNFANTSSPQSSKLSIETFVNTILSRALLAMCDAWSWITHASRVAAPNQLQSEHALTLGILANDPIAWEALPATMHFDSYYLPEPLQTIKISPSSRASLLKTTLHFVFGASQAPTNFHQFQSTTGLTAVIHEISVLAGVLCELERRVDPDLSSPALNATDSDEAWYRGHLRQRLLTWTAWDLLARLYPQDIVDILQRSAKEHDDVPLPSDLISSQPPKPQAYASAPKALIHDPGLLLLLWKEVGEPTFYHNSFHVMPAGWMGSTAYEPSRLAFILTSPLLLPLLRDEQSWKEALSPLPNPLQSELDEAAARHRNELRQQLSAVIGRLTDGWTLLSLVSRWKCGLCDGFSPLTTQACCMYFVWGGGNRSDLERRLSSLPEHLERLHVIAGAVRVGLWHLMPDTEVTAYRPDQQEDPSPSGYVERQLSSSTDTQVLHDAIEGQLVSSNRSLNSVNVRLHLPILWQDIPLSQVQYFITGLVAECNSPELHKCLVIDECGDLCVRVEEREPNPMLQLQDRSTLRISQWVTRWAPLLGDSVIGTNSTSSAELERVHSCSLVDRPTMEDADMPVLKFLFSPTHLWRWGQFVVESSLVYPSSSDDRERHEQNSLLQRVIEGMQSFILMIISKHSYIQDTHCITCTPMMSAPLPTADNPAQTAASQLCSILQAVVKSVDELASTPSNLMLAVDQHPAQNQEQGEYVLSVTFPASISFSALNALYHELRLLAQDIVSSSLRELWEFETCLVMERPVLSFFSREQQLCMCHELARWLDEVHSITSSFADEAQCHIEDLPLPSHAFRQILSTALSLSPRALRGELLIWRTMQQERFPSAHFSEDRICTIEGLSMLLDRLIMRALVQEVSDDSERQLADSDAALSAVKLMIQRIECPSWSSLMTSAIRTALGLLKDPSAPHNILFCDESLSAEDIARFVIRARLLAGFSRPSVIVSPTQLSSSRSTRSGRDTAFAPAEVLFNWLTQDDWLVNSNGKNKATERRRPIDLIVLLEPTEFDNILAQSHDDHETTSLSSYLSCHVRKQTSTSDMRIPVVHQTRRDARFVRPLGLMVVRGQTAHCGKSAFISHWFSSYSHASKHTHPSCIESFDLVFPADVFKVSFEKRDPSCEDADPVFIHLSFSRLEHFVQHLPTEAQRIEYLRYLDRALSYLIYLSPLCKTAETGLGMQNSVRFRVYLFIEVPYFRDENIEALVSRYIPYFSRRYSHCFESRTLSFNTFSNLISNPPLQSPVIVLDISLQFNPFLFLSKPSALEHDKSLTPAQMVFKVLKSFAASRIAALGGPVWKQQPLQPEHLTITYIRNQDEVKDMQDVIRLWTALEVSSIRFKRTEELTAYQWRSFVARLHPLLLQIVHIFSRLAAQDKHHMTESQSAHASAALGLLTVPLLDTAWKIADQSAACGFVDGFVLPEQYWKSSYGTTGKTIVAVRSRESVPVVLQPWLDLHRHSQHCPACGVSHVVEVEPNWSAKLTELLNNPSCGNTSESLRPFVASDMLQDSFFAHQRRLTRVLVKLIGRSPDDAVEDAKARRHALREERARIRRAQIRLYNLHLPPLDGLEDYDSTGSTSSSTSGEESEDDVKDSHQEALPPKRVERRSFFESLLDSMSNPTDSLLDLEPLSDDEGRSTGGMRRLRSRSVNRDRVEFADIMSDFAGCAREYVQPSSEAMNAPWVLDWNSLSAFISLSEFYRASSFIPPPQRAILVLADSHAQAAHFLHVASHALDIRFYSIEVASDREGLNKLNWRADLLRSLNETKNCEAIMNGRAASNMIRSFIFFDVSECDIPSELHHAFFELLTRRKYENIELPPSTVLVFACDATVSRQRTALPADGDMWGYLLRTSHVLKLSLVRPDIPVGEPDSSHDLPLVEHIYRTMGILRYFLSPAHVQSPAFTHLLKSLDQSKDLLRRLLHRLSETRSTRSNNATDSRHMTRLIALRQLISAAPPDQANHPSRLVTNEDFAIIVPFFGFVLSQMYKTLPNSVTPYHVEQCARRLGVEISAVSSTKLYHLCADDILHLDVSEGHPDAAETDVQPQEREIVTSAFCGAFTLLGMLNTLRGVLYRMDLGYAPSILREYLRGGFSEDDLSTLHPGELKGPARALMLRLLDIVTTILGASEGEVLAHSPRLTLSELVLIAVTCAENKQDAFVLVITLGLAFYHDEDIPMLSVLGPASSPLMRLESMRTDSPGEFAQYLLSSIKTGLRCICIGTDRNILDQVGKTLGESKVGWRPMQAIRFINPGSTRGQCDLTTIHFIEYIHLRRRELANLDLIFGRLSDRGKRAVFYVPDSFEPGDIDLQQESPGSLIAPTLQSNSSGVLIEREQWVVCSERLPPLLFKLCEDLIRALKWFQERGGVLETLASESNIVISHHSILRDLFDVASLFSQNEVITTLRRTLSHNAEASLYHDAKWLIRHLLQMMYNVCKLDSLERLLSRRASIKALSDLIPILRHALTVFRAMEMTDPGCIQRFAYEILVSSTSRQEYGSTQVYLVGTTRTFWKRDVRQLLNKDLNSCCVLSRFTSRCEHTAMKSMCDMCIQHALHAAYVCGKPIIIVDAPQISCSTQDYPEEFALEWWLSAANVLGGLKQRNPTGPIIFVVCINENESILHALATITTCPHQSGVRSAIEPLKQFLNKAVIHVATPSTITSPPPRTFLQAYLQVEPSHRNPPLWYARQLLHRRLDQNPCRSKGRVDWVGIHSSLTAWLLEHSRLSSDLPSHNWIRATHSEPLLRKGCGTNRIRFLHNHLKSQVSSVFLHLIDFDLLHQGELPWEVSLALEFDDFQALAAGHTQERGVCMLLLDRSTVILGDRSNLLERLLLKLEQFSLSSHQHIIVVELTDVTAYSEHDKESSLINDRIMSAAQYDGSWNVELLDNVIPTTSQSHLEDSGLASMLEQPFDSLLGHPRAPRPRIIIYMGLQMSRWFQRELLDDNATHILIETITGCILHLIIQNLRRVLEGVALEGVDIKQMSIVELCLFMSHLMEEHIQELIQQSVLGYYPLQLAIGEGLESLLKCAFRLLASAGTPASAVGSIAGLSHTFNRAAWESPMHAFLLTATGLPAPRFRTPVGFLIEHFFASSPTSLLERDAYAWKEALMYGCFSSSLLTLYFRSASFALVDILLAGAAQQLGDDGRSNEDSTAGFHNLSLLTARALTQGSTLSNPLSGVIIPLVEASIEECRLNNLPVEPWDVIVRRHGFLEDVPLHSVSGTQGLIADWIYLAPSCARNCDYETASFLALLLMNLTEVPTLLKDWTIRELKQSGLSIARIPALFMWLSCDIWPSHVGRLLESIAGMLQHCGPEVRSGLARICQLDQSVAQQPTGPQQVLDVVMKLQQQLMQSNYRIPEEIETEFLSAALALCDRLSEHGDSQVLLQLRLIRQRKLHRLALDSKSPEHFTKVLELTTRYETLCFFEAGCLSCLAAFISSMLRAAVTSELSPYAAGSALAEYLSSFSGIKDLGGSGGSPTAADLCAWCLKSRRYIAERDDSNDTSSTIEFGRAVLVTALTHAPKSLSKVLLSWFQSEITQMRQCVLGNEVLRLAAVLKATPVITDLVASFFAHLHLPLISTERLVTLLNAESGLLSLTGELRTRVVPLLVLNSICNNPPGSGHRVTHTESLTAIAEFATQLAPYLIPGSYDLADSKSNSLQRLSVLLSAVEEESSKYSDVVGHAHRCPYMFAFMSTTLIESRPWPVRTPHSELEPTAALQSWLSPCAETAIIAAASLVITSAMCGSSESECTVDCLPDAGTNEPIRPTGLMMRVLGEALVESDALMRAVTALISNDIDDLLRHVTYLIRDDSNAAIGTPAVAAWLQPVFLALTRPAHLIAQASPSISFTRVVLALLHMASSILLGTHQPHALVYTVARVVAERVSYFSGLSLGLLVDLDPWKQQPRWKSFRCEYFVRRLLKSQEILVHSDDVDQVGLAFSYFVKRSVSESRSSLENDLCRQLESHSSSKSGPSITLAIIWLQHFWRHSELRGYFSSLLKCQVGARTLFNQNTSVLSFVSGLVSMARLLFRVTDAQASVGGPSDEGWQWISVKRLLIVAVRLGLLTGLFAERPGQEEVNVDPSLALTTNPSFLTQVVALAELDEEHDVKDWQPINDEYLSPPQIWAFSLKYGSDALLARAFVSNQSNAMLALGSLFPTRTLTSAHYLVADEAIESSRATRDVWSRLGRNHDALAALLITLTESPHSLSSESHDAMWKALEMPIEASLSPELTRALFCVVEGILADAGGPVSNQPTHKNIRLSALWSKAMALPPECTFASSSASQNFFALTEEPQHERDAQSQQHVWSIDPRLRSILPLVTAVGALAVLPPPAIAHGLSPRVLPSPLTVTLASFMQALMEARVSPSTSHFSSLIASSAISDTSELDPGMPLHQIFWTLLRECLRCLAILLVVPQHFHRLIIPKPLDALWLALRTLRCALELQVPSTEDLESDDPAFIPVTMDLCYSWISFVLGRYARAYSQLSQNQTLWEAWTAVISSCQAAQARQSLATVGTLFWFRQNSLAAFHTTELFREACEPISQPHMLSCVITLQTMASFVYQQTLSHSEEKEPHPLAHLAIMSEDRSVFDTISRDDAFAVSDEAEEEINKQRIRRYIKITEEFLHATTRNIVDMLCQIDTHASHPGSVCSASARLQGQVAIFKKALEERSQRSGDFGYVKRPQKLLFHLIHILNALCPSQRGRTEDGAPPNDSASSYSRLLLVAEMAPMLLSGSTPLSGLISVLRSLEAAVSTFVPHARQVGQPLGTHAVEHLDPYPTSLPCPSPRSASSFAASSADDRTFEPHNPIVLLPVRKNSTSSLADAVEPTAPLRGRSHTHLVNISEGRRQKGHNTLVLLVEIVVSLLEDTGIQLSPVSDLKSDQLLPIHGDDLLLLCSSLVRSYEARSLNRCVNNDSVIDLVSPDIREDNPGLAKFRSLRVSQSRVLVMHATRLQTELSKLTTSDRMHPYPSMRDAISDVHESYRIEPQQSASQTPHPVPRRKVHMTLEHVLPRSAEDSDEDPSIWSDSEGDTTSDDEPDCIDDSQAEYLNHLMGKQVAAAASRPKQPSLTTEDYQVLFDLIPLAYNESTDSLSRLYLSGANYAKYLEALFAAILSQPLDMWPWRSRLYQVHQGESRHMRKISFTKLGKLLQTAVDTLHLNRGRRYPSTSVLSPSLFNDGGAAAGGTASYEVLVRELKALCRLSLAPPTGVQVASLLYRTFHPSFESSSNPNSGPAPAPILSVDMLVQPERTSSLKLRQKLLAMTADSMADNRFASQLRFNLFTPPSAALGQLVGHERAAQFLNMIKHWPQLHGTWLPQGVLQLSRLVQSDVSTLLERGHTLASGIHHALNASVPPGYWPKTMYRTPETNLLLATLAESVAKLTVSEQPPAPVKASVYANIKTVNEAMLASNEWWSFGFPPLKLLACVLRFCLDSDLLLRFAPEEPLEQWLHMIAETALTEATLKAVGETPSTSNIDLETELDDIAYLWPLLGTALSILDRGIMTKARTFPRIRDILWLYELLLGLFVEEAVAFTTLTSATLG